MAVYNLEALALKTKYLMDTANLSQQEAEQKAFAEAGINEMSQEARTEYDRLLTTGTKESEFARNDGERILDRRATTDYRTYEQPQEPTQEPPQDPKEF
jgi:hypothetical protein